MWLKKYKYPLIVVLVGLVFILLPTKGDVYQESVAQSPLNTDDVPFEQALSELLSKVHGAGKVEIILTVSKGEEVLYQSDSNITHSTDSSGTKTSTVIVSDNNRVENGLIRQVNPAEYRGAIIICQGADNPSVKLALIEAVSKVTGIGTNAISVLKMR